MKTSITLKDGAKIEVRINNGRIEAISYENHGQMKEAVREEKEEMRFRLKIIFNENVEKFKEILTTIKEDEEFYSYGKQLLDARRVKLVEGLFAYKAEVSRRMKQMQAEIDKFSLVK